MARSALTTFPFATDGASPSAAPFYAEACASSEGEWVSPQLDTANGTVDVLNYVSNTITRVSLASPSGVEVPCALT